VSHLRDARQSRPCAEIAGSAERDTARDLVELLHSRGFASAVSGDRRPGLAGISPRSERSSACLLMATISDRSVPSRSSVKRHALPSTLPCSGCGPPVRVRGVGRSSPLDRAENGMMKRPTYAGRRQFWQSPCGLNLPPHQSQRSDRVVFPCGMSVGTASAVRVTRIVRDPTHMRREFRRFRGNTAPSRRYERSGMRRVAGLIAAVAAAAGITVAGVGAAQGDSSSALCCERGASARAAPQQRSHTSLELARSGCARTTSSQLGSTTARPVQARATSSPLKE